MIDSEDDGDDEDDAAEQSQPVGKPLDLKNRGKGQPNGEAVTGRDFDPETGEIFQPSKQSKIFKIPAKAAEG